MPYIESKKDRTDLICGKRDPNNAGELNFLITSITHVYIEQHKLCYSTLNEVIGILECAKLELYRMVAAPYENEKLLENGPISDLDVENDLRAE